MVIFAISASGIGAGKTTLAKKLGNPVWSLAGGLRQELSLLYPKYNWENRDQSYKDTTIVKECGKRTIREVMVMHGQMRCESNPLYWVERLCDRLKDSPALGSVVAIDDVRKVNEIQHIKFRFPGQVVHLHVDYDLATKEPEFQNEELKAMADYIIKRNV
jgi:hypothetical protein